MTIMTYTEKMKVLFALQNVPAIHVCTQGADAVQAFARLGWDTSGDSWPSDKRLIDCIPFITVGTKMEDSTFLLCLRLLKEFKAQKALEDGA